MPREHNPFDGSQLCAQTDPELFFPVKGDQTNSRIAQGICAKCPLKVACFNYAVKYKVVGIWGGTTEKERYLFQRKHGIKPLDITIGMK